MLNLVAAIAGAAITGAGATVVATPRVWVRTKTAVTAKAMGRERLMSDLAAVETGLPVWLTLTARSLIVAVVSGGLAGAVAAAAGLPSVVVLVGVAFGIWFGLLIPRARLSNQADRARNRLNTTAVEIAELMSLALAANLGIEAAFELAIDTLPGTTRIAAATAVATPWEALEAFGQTTGAERVADMGRILQVSAEQRARVRDTLLGWAATVRQAALAQGEAKAASATETMSAPLVLTAMSLFLFLGIPALIKVFAGVTNIHTP
jgi:hypothetical protein